MTSPTSATPPARRGRLIVILLVAAAVIALLIVFWPGRTGAPTAGHRDVMTSDLRGLLSSEVVYFRQNHRFTAALDSTVFMSSVGVNPPTVTLVDSGWTATITHPRSPGVTCAVAVLAKNPLQSSASDGEIVCK